jgi:hypothetical protein
VSQVTLARNRSLHFLDTQQPRILHLEPVGRAAGAIRRVLPLRRDASCIRQCRPSSRRMRVGASVTADKQKHRSAVGRVIQGVGHRTKSVDKRKKSLRQRLGDVCDAWDDFQENRFRDAVYGYLRAVFSIVKHYRGRRQTKKLMRRAYKFAGLPVDMNADPFAVVIRCTCEHKLDNKTISKWSRALRYVERVKKPRHQLTTFMKNRGGVNACAERYAKYFGRCER